MRCLSQQVRLLNQQPRILCQQWPVRNNIRIECYNHRTDRNNSRIEC